MPSEREAVGRKSGDCESAVELQCWRSRAVTLPAVPEQCQKSGEKACQELLEVCAWPGEFAGICGELNDLKGGRCPFG